jgi:hypothetical protein
MAVFLAGTILCLWFGGRPETTQSVATIMLFEQILSELSFSCILQYASFQPLT